MARHVLWCLLLSVAGCSGYGMGGFGIEYGKDALDSGAIPEENEDMDDDGDPASSDCDDEDPSVYSSGGEVDIVDGAIVDRCENDIDNDCDGEVDDEADCGDADGDGERNGIDLFRAVDADGDGEEDTLCVVARDLSLPAPWDEFDAYVQGDAWGDGFDAVDMTLDEAGESKWFAKLGWQDWNDDGSEDDQAWCVEFEPGAFTTNAVSFRLVSGISADGLSNVPSECDPSDAASTWVPMDIDAYCRATNDPWCYALADDDGCGNDIGFVAHVRYDSETGSIRAK